MTTENGPVSADGPCAGRPTVVWLITGALSAALTPAWGAWARAHAREVRFQVFVSRSAARFVSLEALSLLLDAPVHLDTWDAADHPHDPATHVRLGQEADAFLIYPATAALVADLALGLPSTPVRSAVMASTAEVFVGLFLPPGMSDSEQFTPHLEKLQTRERFTVFPTTAIPSATIEDVTAVGPAVSFPEAVAEVISTVRSPLAGGARPAFETVGSE